jgi:hypothetical protein
MSRGSNEEGGAGGVEGVGAVLFDHLAQVGRMGGGGAAVSFTSGNGGRGTLGSGKEREESLGGGVSAEGVTRLQGGHEWHGVGSR